MAYTARERAVVVVTCASALVLASCAYRFDPFRGSADVFLILMLLAIIGEASAVQHIARLKTTVSFASIVGLAAVPLTGVFGAMVVSALSCLVVLRTRSVLVAVYNASMYAVMTGSAGITYYVAGGEPATALPGTPWALLGSLLLPHLLANVVQCFVNAVLMATIVSATARASWVQLFGGLLRQGGVSYVGYGLFGLLLVVLWEPAGVGPLSAVLVLAPLYVARWAWAQYAEEQQAYERTVRTLVEAVEKKDVYTRGHSERVAKASSMIAQVVRLESDRARVLRFAGILHDVGKLGVPTRVLQKTGRLTDQEFDAIALHPVRGLEMVRDIEFLGEAFDGILHHHERLDGRGYPMGLAGQAIPEFARIISVADAFDSMTSTRSYRSARTVQEAVVELRRCSGTQFDPTFVDALVTALETEEWTPITASPRGEPVTAAAGGWDHDDPVVQEDRASRTRTPAAEQHEERA